MTIKWVKAKAQLVSAWKRGSGFCVTMQDNVKLQYQNVRSLNDEQIKNQYFNLPI